MTVLRSHGPPQLSADWAFFLDVDGTLIEIAETPDTIHVDAALRDLIGRLSQASGGAVALISGRALADLHDRLGALNLPMAGSHGLERCDANGRLWVHAAPLAAKDEIQEALAPVLARHPGLFLENKGLSLALHYRRAPQLAGYVNWIMGCLLSQAGPNSRLQHGKCVVEIMPAGVDKGTAVVDYLAEPPFRGRRAVFIGDDLNDEHAFARVNGLDGISIKVGKGASCARFRLSDVAAVRRWLETSAKGNA